MNRSRSLAARLAVLLLALASSACVSVARQESLDAKEARWKSIEVDSPSDRVVWQLSLLALQSQGYPLGPGTDPGEREIHSGWKTDLQPFRGDGTRRRAILRLEPVEAGRWKLEARVRVESNQNLVAPLDPVRAEWKAAPDDEGAAQVLLQHVRSRLKPELSLGGPEGED
jgi:hypothetical protein